MQKYLLNSINYLVERFIAGTGFLKYSVLYSISVLWLMAVGESYATVGLTVRQVELRATPGATCMGLLTINNPTDTVDRVRLRMVSPPAFHLLNQLPPELILQPHSVLTLPLKFMISQNWSAEHGIVFVEAYRTNTEPPEASVQFIIRQREHKSEAQGRFFLVNENPYLPADQDTLRVGLRLQNISYQSRSFRLILHSLPEGFKFSPALAAGIRVEARHDTLLSLQCLSRALSRERAYEIVIEVQDMATNSMLGSVVCRPVLLASTKRVQSTDLSMQAPAYGVSVGYSSLGQAGTVYELKGWGERSMGKGTLSFNTHLLNYRSNNSSELRDTYVQYRQSDFLVRVGSLYDFHELPLSGTGVKAGFTLRDTHIEAWAVRNVSNLLRTFSNSNLTPDATYSVRVSGAIPFRQNAYYSLNSSYYSIQRTNRVGTLHAGSIDWQLSPQSKLKITTGHSMEYDQRTGRQRSRYGWAVGTDYTHESARFSVETRTFFSNPHYAGMQRGASLVEHRLFYKKNANTQLNYRLSRLAYNQRFMTVETPEFQNMFNSTMLELGAARIMNQFTATVRPYFWHQRQASSTQITLQSQSYRLSTGLRYTANGGGYSEVGIDGGVYAIQATNTGQPYIPVYRFTAGAGLKNFSIFSTYQRGPYQLSDQQNVEKPHDLRQFIISPAYQFMLLDNRLKGGLGAVALFNSSFKVWNSFLNATLTYAVNETLNISTIVNLNSIAEKLDEMSAIPLQSTQFRFELSKTFRRSTKKTRHNLSLRFYEDHNGNKQKDGDEPWLEGLVVNVNRMALVSNQKGSVVCKGLPTGLAIVNAQCKIASGEAVLLTDSVWVGKSVQRDIPIRKTTAVAGRLVCNEAKYSAEPCELDIYRIEARNDLGELFRTYADERGDFKLYLPPGHFTISVFNSLRPNRALTKTIDHTVSQTVKATNLLIEVDSGTRPVKVKRFGQQVDTQP